MNLDRVTTGNDVPHEINVVIEIPMNSEPIKYELDNYLMAPKRTGERPCEERAMSRCFRCG